MCLYWLTLISFWLSSSLFIKLQTHISALRLCIAVPPSVVFPPLPWPYILFTLSRNNSENGMSDYKRANIIEMELNTRR